jgi:hypothetical protein
VGGLARGEVAALERLAVSGADGLAERSAVRLGGEADGAFYKVAYGGSLRNESPLTASQRARVESYLSKFDLNDVQVRWVDDTNLDTGYMHGNFARVLNISSDVVPESAGFGTRMANSRIGIEGTLAHELVGHREAALAGMTQDILTLEEAQASIRAARFGPDLTSTERYTLLRDAVTRLNRDGIRVRDVKDQLYIEQR